MKINNITAKFNNIKTSLISPAVFMTVGALKMHSDYKNTPQGERKKIMATDFTLLSSAGLGFLATSLLLSKFYKLNVGQFLNKGFEKISAIAHKSKIFQSDFVKNFKAKFHKPQNKMVDNIGSNIGEILKGCFDNTITTVGGIVVSVLAAIHLLPKIEEKMPSEKIAQGEMSEQDKNILNAAEAATEAENKSTISQNELDEIENTKKQFMSEQISNFLDGKSASAIVSIIADYPELKGLGSAMMSLTAYEIAREKDHQTRFKKAAYEIVTYTLVPAFFVSIASVVTKNMKAIIKIPAILGSLFLGAFAGSKIAQHAKNEFDNFMDTKIFNNYTQNKDKEGKNEHQQSQ